MALAECRWLGYVLARSEAPSRQRPLRIVAAAVASLLAVVIAAGAAGADVAPSMLIVQSSPTAGLVAVTLATNSVSSPIAVPAANGTSPLFVAVTPDGTKAYVDISNNQMTGTGPSVVIPIDLTSHTAGSPIQLPANGNPFGLAITPDGRTLYVADIDTAMVSVIDVATDTVTTNIAVGLFPFQIAITPDGKKAYVTNAVDGTVSVIDTATNQVTTTIAGFNGPLGIQVTPDGKTAYVVNGNAPDPMNNLPGNDVQAIDVATDSLAGTPIPVGGGAMGSNPQGIAISPDGTKGFVTVTGASAVTPIDLTTGTRQPDIAVGNNPQFVAVSTDGTTAYVTNAGDNTVTTIDVTTDTTVQNPAFAVSDGPDDIIDIPDHAPTASFTVTAAPAGTASDFDGTASSAPDGSISRYVWTFGDGTTSTTTMPTTTHVYATGGNYSASLQVFSAGGTSTQTTYTGQGFLNIGGPQAVASHPVVVPAAGPPGPTPTTVPTSTPTTTPTTPSTGAPTTTTTIVPGTIPAGGAGGVAGVEPTAGSGSVSNPGTSPVTVRAGVAPGEPANDLGLVAGSAAVVGGLGTAATVLGRRRRRLVAPRDGRRHRT